MTDDEVLAPLQGALIALRDSFRKAKLQFLAQQVPVNQIRTAAEINLLKEQLGCIRVLLRLHPPTETASNHINASLRRVQTLVSVIEEILVNRHG